MNQKLTVTGLPEETGKILPFDRRSMSDTGTSLVSIENKYIPSTDVNKHAQLRPGSRAFDVDSFSALNPRDIPMLNLAFDRISQVLERGILPAEASNCFDEWKDLLQAASRKIGSFTSKHRKILGSLLSLVANKDICDFDDESLRAFRDGTNMLRLPRLSKEDARRSIQELSKRGRQILMPLAVDESARDRVKALDDMMEQLIVKSRLLNE